MDKTNQSIRYINPLTDYGFKKVFGDEIIMREFLNDLLQLESPIVHVEFLNKEGEPENDELRGIVYDMRCKTERGNEIIVEMQNRGQTYFADRIIYYLSQSISPQGWKGRKEIENVKDESGSINKKAWNFNLKPVYGIFFLNFHLSELKPTLIRTVRFKVDETGEVFNDKVRAYTIELPCVRDKSEADCKGIMEFWAYNLYNMETMTNTLPFMAQKPIFERMGEIANYSQLSTDEQREYMHSLNTWRTVIAAKEYDYSRGMTDGIVQGRAEGRAEGQLQMALQIAANMKSLNMSIDDIVKATGLSPEQITGS